MDANEIADTFKNLQKEGKVKEFGVSNFTPSQFELLNSHIQLHTNQVEISVLHTDTLYDGTLDQLQKYGVRPMLGLLLLVVEYLILKQLKKNSYATL